MSRLFQSLERDNARSPNGFDVQEPYLRLTFDTINRLAFGNDPGTQLNEGSPELDAFHFMLVDAMRRSINGMLLPEWLDDLINQPRQKYKDSVQLLRSVCYKKIDVFNTGGVEALGGDQSMISSILGEGKLPSWMDREKFVTHLITILFGERVELANLSSTCADVLKSSSAGHDTTSNALTWCTHYLAANPDLQQKIRDEAFATFGPDGEITVEKLESMRYVNAFIKETLRLRPSGPELVRTVNKDVSIAFEENGENYLIDLPKDTIVAYSIYSAANHPSHWPDRPTEFDPDRFLKDPNGGASSVYAYIPFSYGPRRCVGERLALTETRWLLVELCRRYLVKPGVGCPESEMAQDGNMRARNGVWVRLEPLEKNVKV
jgi:cytochrome P450